jgi:hypothetical protein
MAFPMDFSHERCRLPVPFADLPGSGALGHPELPSLGPDGALRNMGSMGSTRSLRIHGEDIPSGND